MDGEGVDGGRAESGVEGEGVDGGVLGMWS